jgi:hypothetical protein
LRIPVTLEVVDCPDRNLLETTEGSLYERNRKATEITAPVSRRRFASRWRQLVLPTAP